MIYFVRLGEDGPIKIGRTVNLSGRMAEHEVFYEAEPIVLGLHDGGKHEESAVHRLFSEFRLSLTLKGKNVRPRELFRPAPEILDYVSRHCRKPDLLDQLHEVTGEKPKERLTSEWKSKPLIVQMRGSVEFKAWLEKAATADRMSVASFLERAAIAYAKTIGFTDPPPER